MVAMILFKPGEMAAFQQAWKQAIDSGKILDNPDVTFGNGFAFSADRIGKQLGLRYLRCKPVEELNAIKVPADVDGCVFANTPGKLSACYRERGTSMGEPIPNSNAMPGRPHRWHSKTRLIAVGAGLTFVVGGVVVIVAVTAGPDTPREVMEAYLKASDEDDYLGAAKYVCMADYQRTVAGGFTSPSVPGNWRILSERIDGDTAEVATDLSAGPADPRHGTVWTFRLVREDGDWLVCGGPVILLQ